MSEAALVDGVRASVGRVIEAGSALREMSVERIATSLARTVNALGAPESDLGREARSVLPGPEALSAEMVDWALASLVTDPDDGELHALGRLASEHAPELVAVPARLCAVVLADGVFTAAHLAVARPLLARAPVIVKAASGADLFVRLWHRALRAVDAELAACVDVLTFRGGLLDVEDAIYGQCDAISVHGSDQTVRTVRARAPATASVVPHGHGLGALFVPRDARATGPLELLDALALDVAAYDQRGCMSPQAIYVERGGPLDAESLARRLSREGLAKLAKALPRGPLPTVAGAQQLQWRGVGAARGTLFEGDGYAVVFEGAGPMRLGPGFRNVSVLEVADEAELGRHLVAFGAHLKTLGVAGDARARARVARALPAPLAPRVCEGGRMQTPGALAAVDGALPFEGLLRWRTVE